MPHSYRTNVSLVSVFGLPSSTNVGRTGQKSMFLRGKLLQKQAAPPQVERGYHTRARSGRCEFESRMPHCKSRPCSTGEILSSSPAQDMVCSAEKSVSARPTLTKARPRRFKSPARQPPSPPLGFTLVQPGARYSSPLLGFTLAEELPYRVEQVHVDYAARRA